MPAFLVPQFVFPTICVAANIAYAFVRPDSSFESIPDKYALLFIIFEKRSH